MFVVKTKTGLLVGDCNFIPMFITFEEASNRLRKVVDSLGSYEGFEGVDQDTGASSMIHNLNEDDFLVTTV